jgi:hypothetical protein
MKEPLQIVDLEGREMEVTDLNLSLMQADDFRHYRVNEPTETHLHLYAYWEDIYQKLLLLALQVND